LKFSVLQELVKTLVAITISANTTGFELLQVLTLLHRPVSCTLPPLP
jgi:hypothetical protein